MIGLLPGQLTNHDRANYAVWNAQDFMGLLGQQPPIAEDAQASLGL